MKKQLKYISYPQILEWDLTPEQINALALFAIILETGDWKLLSKLPESHKQFTNNVYGYMKSYNQLIDEIKNENIN